MLAPALAALSEDDQAYFAQMATGESFEDMIDLFSASFTITEDPPVIRDQKVKHEHLITDTDHRLPEPWE